MYHVSEALQRGPFCGLYKIDEVKWIEWMETRKTTLWE